MDTGLSLPWGWVLAIVGRKGPHWGRQAPIEQVAACSVMGVRTQ